MHNTLLHSDIIGLFFSKGDTIMAKETTQDETEHDLCDHQSRKRMGLPTSEYFEIYYLKK